MPDLGFIVDGFNAILEFISQGFYDIIKAFLARLVVWLTISTIEFKTWALQFAWDIAKQVLIDLNFSTLVQNAFSALDSQIVAVLTFFRIPEVINIIASSAVTKYILRMVGM